MIKCVNVTKKQEAARQLKVNEDCNTTVVLLLLVWLKQEH